jgi:hypothetical protein
MRAGSERGRNCLLVPGRSRNAHDSRDFQRLLFGIGVARKQDGIVVPVPPIPERY